MSDGFAAPVITTPALNVAEVASVAVIVFFVHTPVVALHALLASSWTVEVDASPPVSGEMVARSCAPLGAAPPVEVTCELTNVVAGRIEFGPALTAPRRVVKHRRKANATRFLRLLILMTLFQGTYRLNGLLDRHSI